MDAYVVGKPLQILIAHALRRDRAGQPSQIIIFDEFDGAREVTDRLARLAEVEVTYAASRDDAMTAARLLAPKSIFIDADVGPRSFIRLARLKAALPRINIHVFEEGVGTYRSDLYRGWRERLFRLIGIGTRFGHSRFTDYINVLEPAEYKEKVGEVATVLQISTSIAQVIEDDFDFWAKVFAMPDFPIPGHSECALYMTNWQPEAAIAEKLSAKRVDLYIKPHPHLRDHTLFASGIMAPAGLPAEILIPYLAKNYDIVRIYHHGTSAERYVDLPNVAFFNLSC
ncbi:hypothetical protein ACEYYA_05150 [Paracoccus sp. p3-h83]|uniref:hypothetical protein n=1 Tax=Paracoccus sp. p3-h83 TaxID=3342805 RepID=UPI0035B87598